MGRLRSGQSPGDRDNRTRFTKGTRFDKLNMDIAIRYSGDTLPFPTHCPSEKEIMEDETAMVNLSGFLIRHYADAIHSVCKNGECTISIHYDH